MSYQACFAVIHFWKHLGDNKADLKNFTKPYGNTPVSSVYRYLPEWEGDDAEQAFTVDGNPLDEGYLLVQAWKVDADTHEIHINGKKLPGFGLPERKAGWMTWMHIIPAGALKKGANILRVKRNLKTKDNFVIGDVTVHWRERSLGGIATPAAEPIKK